MAKFTVEYLSLPGSRMCLDSVLTIYEESHGEIRMSDNPYWCLNFVLGDFSVEAVYDQEGLWLGNDTTKMLIHVMGMPFFLDVPNIIKTGFYKTGCKRLYACVCMYVYS